MNFNKTSKRLFIGSLPYKFTEGELLSMFVTEGKVISVRIMHTRWGKSRGIGYVEFENEEDAIRAKEKFHNYQVGDRTIIVDFAQPDPFLTPEGKARHEEAMVKRNKHRRPQQGNSYQANNQNHSESNDKFFDQLGFKPRFGSFSNSNHSQRNSQRSNRPGQKRNEQNKPELKFKPGKHVRQSLFESRNFGARTGAKFAGKNKKNRK
jgi:RNA recognition motif-containing protein